MRYGIVGISTLQINPDNQLAMDSQEKKCMTKYDVNS